MSECNTLTEQEIPIGRNLQMALLAAAAAAGTFGRTALGPLQETMRIALGLSDNQIAILQGPALALPLALAAIPLGFLIDRYSRTGLLLGLAVIGAVGSAATAASSTFWMLVGGRCLVGLMAFGINPVVLSLIADRFHPAERGRATMTMALGQLGGMSAAFAAGGWLLAIYSYTADGWRWTMAWLTAPVALIVPAMLAVREPQRSRQAAQSLTIRIALRELWRVRASIGPVLIGVLTAEIALGATLVWAAPALTRHFALSPDRAGAIMAAGLLVSGALGPIVGGMLADFCQRRGGPRRTSSMIAFVCLLGLPASLFAVPQSLAFATTTLLLFLSICTAICVMGTTLFTVTVPEDVRGLSMGLLVATCVLIGNGLAPLTVSLLSGYMGGSSFVGEALAWIGLSTCLAGAVIFAVGRKTLPAY